MKFRRNTFMMGLLLSACGLMAGCSVIDDDLTDCYDNNKYDMFYQLRLVTNMTTELQTELTTIPELGAASSLKTHLKDIFSDFAHDVDLSFYDTEGTLERLQHDQHIMDANQSSYALTLPMRKYKHLAVANITNNDVVELADDETCNSSQLLQADAVEGVISSHTTGLFTARQPMEVLEGIDQTFNVRLYMANSAVSLILNPKGHKFKDVKVYATGFAKAFYINDSTYVYTDNPPLVLAQQLETGNDLLCFCTVNFPSRDETTRAAENPTLWQFMVYLTEPDGTVTRTVLNISKPLKAGDLKIIKGELDDKGSVRPYDSTVGVSVQLDWSSGSEYESPL